MGCRQCVQTAPGVLVIDQTDSAGEAPPRAPCLTHRAVLWVSAYQTSPPCVSSAVTDGAGQPGAEPSPAACGMRRVGDSRGMW